MMHNKSIVRLSGGILRIYLKGRLSIKAEEEIAQKVQGRLDTVNGKVNVLVDTNNIRNVDMVGKSIASRLSRENRDKVNRVVLVNSNEKYITLARQIAKAANLNFGVFKTRKNAIEWLKE